MPIVSAIMVPHPPLIVPSIGRGDERIISATVEAYKKAADFVMGCAPDTIVITSPHATLYRDYFHISPGKYAHGDFARFGVREVAFDIEYDEELVAAISDEASTAGIPAGTKGERDALLDHGTMVPLFFIDKANKTKANVDVKGLRFVRIGLSGLTLRKHFDFGKCIARAVDRLDRRVAFVASGDLSHKLKHDGPYGFAKEGPEYDERIMEVMGQAAFSQLFNFDEMFLENAAECGHRSFVIMAGALDGMTVTSEKLSHEGTFGVGYGVCTYLINN